MPSETYLNSLKRQAEIHIKKNTDYSVNTNPFSNFEFAALVSEGFQNPVDKVFATLVAVKLARIQVLSVPDKTPNNESLQDSFDDLCVYAGMWGAYNQDKRRPIKEDRVEQKSSHAFVNTHKG